MTGSCDGKDCEARPDVKVVYTNYTAARSYCEECFGLLNRWPLNYAVVRWLDGETEVPV